MAMADESIKAEISKMEAILDGKGRILVRPSGTEPMIRVMIEGEDYGQIEKMADSIAEMIMTRYS
jgi:phosphoglucosamine mutase